VVLHCFTLIQLLHHLLLVETKHYTGFVKLKTSQIDAPLKSCDFMISELFENIGPMTGEIIGSWRKLHNGELHNFYSSPNIVRMIKSRRMR
jgi:hypothetical protein